MGRPNSGLKGHIRAHCHSAKKTPVSIRYRLGVKRYIYRQGWVGKKLCNDSQRDESNEEQLQCRKQYICTPHGTLSPAMAMPAHQMKHRIDAKSMFETTETVDAIMRYTESLTPSPTVAKKETRRWHC